MLLGVLVVLSLMAVPSLSKNCTRECGGVVIPYPFGLGNEDPTCFREGTIFKLLCNKTVYPPMLHGETGPAQILNISLEGQVTIAMPLAFDCYTKDGGIDQEQATISIDLDQGFTFSATKNKLVAIGCDSIVIISSLSPDRLVTGCASFCGSLNSVISGSCSGIGCCEVAIPPNIVSLNISLSSAYNHTETWDYNPCSYVFFAQNDWIFYASDVTNFTDRLKYKYESLQAAPLVLDWAIRNFTCKEAQKAGHDYACGKNTHCSDSTTNGDGYLCRCQNGYDGNPYDLQDGCKDINECENNEDNRYCLGICHNTIGSYTCSCPSGQYGDGTKGGTGCTKQLPVFKLALGTGFCFLFILLGTSWICWTLHKRRLAQLKKKFFHQNGGILLRQKLSSSEYSVEPMKLFTSEELRSATGNFHESRILGRGGYGVVYKGILSDKRTVAIKKSKIVDKEQTEQFINEVLILSQINHRNVVKLLGCCLETENPLLVYEFINNGTLSHHINEGERTYSMSWNNRLRIAAETSGALAYLHSSASQPVIHRDVKCANILLDENYTAKVADFGASRLMSLDATQLSTVIQGTRGYLDPEYMLTSLLTEKSDVYSFGVVLVELLTGRKAFDYDKPEQERNLALYFVSSLEANRLFEVLEQRLVSDASIEQLQEVANLARRCLMLNGDERPTMKEVSMELEGMRVSEKHPWVERNPEESACLVGESFGYHDSSSGYAAISDQFTHSLHRGR